MDYVLHLGNKKNQHYALHRLPYKMVLYSMKGFVVKKINYANSGRRRPPSHYVRGALFVKRPIYQGDTWSIVLLV
jgi:hypothetical protein